MCASTKPSAGAATRTAVCTPVLPTGRDDSADDTCRNLCSIGPAMEWRIRASAAADGSAAKIDAATSSVNVSSKCDTPNLPLRQLVQPACACALRHSPPAPSRRGWSALPWAVRRARRAGRTSAAFFVARRSSAASPGLEPAPGDGGDGEAQLTMALARMEEEDSARVRSAEPGQATTSSDQHHLYIAFTVGGHSRAAILASCCIVDANAGCLA
jgi:sarcosine oxidase gamma subunit